MNNDVKNSVMNPRPEKDTASGNISSPDELKLVMDLSNAFGPSGLEDEVREIIKEDLSNWKTEEDSIGNLYIFPKHLKTPDVLLDAHLDEVGLMVQYVQSNGTMRFLPIGGMNPKELYGQRMTIRSSKGEKIPAICGTIPGHYQQAKELEFTDLHLDAGVLSKAEAAHMGLEAGCFAVPDTRAVFNPATGVMQGKAFDDRIGVAALLQTLKELKNKDPQAAEHVIAICSSQEEVGERGSSAAVRRLEQDVNNQKLESLPKVCICFEGCPADDTFEPEDAVQSGMKRGPMIRARDRSMITHPKLLAFARKTAREKNLPLQIAVRSGGGTNAGIYHLYNIPTLVIGIPVRYAHACAGFFAWQDYEDAVQLAIEIISALNSSFSTQQEAEKHG